MSPGLLLTGFTGISTAAAHMPSATALYSLGCPRYIINMPVESSVESLVANEICTTSLQELVKPVSLRDGEEMLADKACEGEQRRRIVYTSRKFD